MLLSRSKVFSVPYRNVLYILSFISRVFVLNVSKVGHPADAELQSS
jgi:hypothetical protein